MESTIKNILEKLKDKKLAPTSFSSDNILYLLGIHYNEVVICRLIKAIIEPNGFHGLGDIPFKLFMQNVLGVEKFEIKQPEIILEEKITDNRRVDIAIYNNGYVYPIEVKIWAKDQDQQLNDYYNYYDKNLEKPSIDKIYYLTPDGHSPSLESRGNLNPVKIGIISFYKADTKIRHIKEYLKDILQQTKNDDCKKIINNLIEVIDVMASDNKRIEEFKGVFRETEEKGKVLSLLKYADNLWEFAREEYLKQSLKEYIKDDGFLVIPKEFSKVDSHGIFGFIYGNEEFYLCVDTNLYIATNKAKDNWKKYDNTGYFWRYVSAKDSEKEKWNLKTIDEELFNKTIDWEKYL